MSPESPLDGVRVTTIEQAVAAPLCTRHLADLGADVVKVERPGAGDFARGYDRYVGGHASHFVWLNRGKRSIALDLKRTAGIFVLKQLLEHSDVLVSNLGPGAVERLLPDKELESRFPRLIRCRISGYGPDGPYRDRKSYDALVQGEAGVTANTGTPTAPAKPGVSLADLAGGVYAFGAITTALYERERTGRGRRIDISLFDAVAEWMMPLLLAERYAGAAPPPAGAGHASISPYGPYTTADDIVVNLAVQNHGQWRRLCLDVLDEPGLLEDPRFATNQDRNEHRVALEAAVQTGIGQLSFAAVRDRLMAADVPWGRLNGTAEVVAHPQLVDRERWIQVTLPDGAPAEVLGHPFLMDLPPRPTPHVPRLGEHGPDVLTGLGYTGDEIAAMIDDGVLGADLAN